MTADFIVPQNSCSCTQKHTYMHIWVTIMWIIHRYTCIYISISIASIRPLPWWQWVEAPATPQEHGHQGWPPALSAAPGHGSATGPCLSSGCCYVADCLGLCFLPEPSSVPIPREVTNAQGWPCPDAPGLPCYWLGQSDGSSYQAFPGTLSLGSLQQFLEKLNIPHIHLIDTIRNTQLPESHFLPFALSVS